MNMDLNKIDDGSGYKVKEIFLDNEASWDDSDGDVMCGRGDGIEHVDLEMNWTKLREAIGSTEYNKIIADGVKKWLSYDGTERIESLLKHEGLIDTKRENGLTNLLDEEEQF